MMMIRCGDCVHSFRTKTDRCACDLLECYVSATWFCANGRTHQSLITNSERVRQHEVYLTDAHDAQTNKRIDYISENERN